MFRTTFGEMFGRRLAEPESARRASGDRLVQLPAGFFGHPELARSEARVDFLGRRARERDFEIVNQARAIHGDRGDEPPLHEIDDHGRQAGLDDVRPESPDDGPIAGPGRENGVDDRAKISGGEQVRPRREPPRETSRRIPRRREALVAHFALPLVEGIGLDAGEIELFVLHGDALV